MSRRHPPAFIVVALLALAVLAPATQEVAARPALEAVAAAALPPEARATLESIHRGGPFPNSRDGVVFGNREHILPAQPRGYYHEYTVPTLGVRTRGARRIVCGGDVTSVSECYYSDDHYQTFRRIRP
ncbi:MAG TPA: ribonuclease domain-containing protein [Casimicrobiaceae bacterium]|nr:ribonuclease domain-containing protein [Casimicrobiaceae bacterium]